MARRSKWWLTPLFFPLAAFGQVAGHGPSRAEWLPFDPPADTFKFSPIDLRGLNEKEAGDGGFIQAKDGHFIHSANGEPVRFWAVNGPSRDLDEQAMTLAARTFAKRGVNLVRTHAPAFNEDFAVGAESVEKVQRLVRCMKSAGIYTHLSLYFPLWYKPKAGDPVLEGYDGSKNSFAVLYFNPKFQEQYRQMLKTVLTTPDPATGKQLLDDPAVFGIEVVNEDSFFFWTFNYDNLPAPQMHVIEGMFGEWLAKKYGSLEKASAAWGGLMVPQDDFAAGRAGFRPMWNIANQRTPRDIDTATFLAETQRDFYARTVKYLRELGFKGQITASNWITASPEFLGPIERLTYLAGDFIDRHGYFSGKLEGEFSGWSLRAGQTYTDRSALRFTGTEPGSSDFTNPANDIRCNDKPSMVSEMTYNRPNRFRTEGPMFTAAYAALQDSGCIVNFAVDDGRWSVKPTFFMQPWTVMGPTQAGQFPAAALAFRKGLVATGDLMADFTLAESDVLGLKGVGPVQKAALDALRAKDVPPGATVAKADLLDPLVHYVGRTAVKYDPAGVTRADVKNFEQFIDRKATTVTSSTRELQINWRTGVLTVNAPCIASVTGNVKAAGGHVTAGPLTVTSDMDLLSISAVALDGQPLATSGSMLLQVMSEERPTDWKTEPDGSGGMRIVSIGHDPWQIRRITGTVAISRPDAEKLRVMTLDLNGYTKKALVGGTALIALDPDCVYYYISK